MSETTDDKTISAPKRTLGLKRGVERDTVRQSFSHGRTNTVTVERKKRRVVMPGEQKAEPPAPAPVAPPRQKTEQRRGAPSRPAPSPERNRNDADTGARAGLVLRQLSSEEIDARARALADAKVHEAEERRAAIDAAARRAAEAERVAKEQAEAARRQAEEDARHKADEAVRARAEETARRRFGEEEKKPAAAKTAEPAAAARPAPAKGQRAAAETEDDERPGAALRGRVKTPRAAEPKPAKRVGDDRRRGKLTVSNALDDTERARSLASIRRRRERERARTHDGPREKISRE
jgi:translation initiation factor IF-2